MAGFYLLLTLTWNADYGGQKDWDLFSPAALPAALLLAWALPRALPERSALRAAGFAVVVTQGVNLLTWVWRNTLPR
jgi:4-amino-4-deoxy-L-arabinose transferase-like glycosyltransferase